MNKLRLKFLDDQMKGALTRALAVQERHLEPDSRVACSAFIVGAAVAGGESVRTIKTLDRLWGMQGNSDKATRLLQTWAMRLLSEWLSWMDGDRPAEDKRRARLMWGEVLLKVFSDLSEDNLVRFMGRDIQRQFEDRCREEWKKTGEDRVILVETSLLLSDLVVALGGSPLFSPTPMTGYPYEGTRDLIDRGGVKQLASTKNAVGDPLMVLLALNTGTKVCADFYKESSARFDEEMKALLAQLRQLLKEGHTIEGLKADARWSSWIGVFGARNLLSAADRT